MRGLCYGLTFMGIPYIRAAQEVICRYIEKICQVPKCIIVRLSLA